MRSVEGAERKLENDEREVKAQEMKREFKKMEEKEDGTQARIWNGKGQEPSEGRKEGRKEEGKASLV